MHRPFQTTLVALFAIFGGAALIGCGGGDEDMESGGAYYDNNTSYGAPYGDEGWPEETSPEVPEVNGWTDPLEDNLATFSVDVDTASYTSARRDLQSNRLPAATGVRVEEFVNFFDYDYSAPEPGADAPFAVHLEAAPSPFGEDLHLLRVGIKGEEIPEHDRDPANLVFLVDVSGSMSAPNKLGLVKYSLGVLLDALREDDTIAIVTYAGSERVALEPTPASHRGEILEAIESLTSGGGSTGGEAGIRRAYSLASENFREIGTNRVILCTDGDFNVGLTGGALVDLVASWRDRGITLSVFGFGGQFNDSFLEELTNNGNGNYAFIDSPNEALRVLSDNVVGTLQVIAKDVKIQLEINADVVARYRLVGYENRDIADEDFRNDIVDAGDIGSGHSVTAFLEVELHEGIELDDQQIAVVRMRYKTPSATSADEAFEIEQKLPLRSMADSFESASESFRFGAAVTEFAEILRHSEHAEGARFDEVTSIARGAASSDETDRLELIDLVERAAGLWR